MRSARRVVVATALALSAVIASSGLALGNSTNKYTSPNVWGTVGPFGSYATFYAQWSAARTISSSGTDWTITNLELDGLIRNGRTCDPAVCSGWGWTFTAKFYDSHSTQVASLTVPAGICYTYPIIDPNSYWLYRCKTSFKFHTSDTSVVQLARAKFTWNVGVWLYGYFYTPGWSYTSGYINFG